MKNKLRKKNDRHFRRFISKKRRKISFRAHNTFFPKGEMEMKKKKKGDQTTQNHKPNTVQFLLFLCLIISFYPFLREKYKPLLCKNLMDCVLKLTLNLIKNFLSSIINILFKGKYSYIKEIKYKYYYAQV